MPFLKSLSVRCPDDEFPFSVPSIRSLEGGMKLHPKVTFLVGENGMGKSTLLEGIADKWGFSEESGNRAKSPNVRDYDTRLAPAMTLPRSPGMRPMDGFFLRAESFFNFATEMDELEKDPYCANGYFSYGGKSLHEQSHGESFFSLFLHRLDGHGLYLLDEPEAALSATRQMAFLVRLHDLVEDFSQFIIATHSPIILAYPEATIYQFSEDGIEEVSYRESQAYEVTHRFLKDPEGMVKRLLED
ncbi:AAA family ATPase [Verrucomicrobiaceae bacterium 227]